VPAGMVSEGTRSMDFLEKQREKEEREKKRKME
jgi:hypothetical protein